MLLSRTSQYAISGVLRLAALPAGGFCRVEDLLIDTDAPPHAVAKVFCELARRGILDSVRGSGGGFRLNERTLSLSLLQIVEAVDGPWNSDVIAPRGLCIPGHPCPLAAVLQPVGDALERLLRTTTVTDLIRSEPQPSGCCPSGCNRKSSSDHTSTHFAENSHEHESTRVRQSGRSGRSRGGGRGHRGRQRPNRQGHA